jgi:DNA-binding NtrC family response regulator
MMGLENNSINILIVDDELSVRQSLYKWFLEEGYRVDTAKDAEEALKKFRQNRWDIVLLDIRMPDMDGLELQRRIREYDEGVIVIIITAYGSIETAVQAIKQGAYDYVTKPFDPDDLEHLIRNAVEQRRLRAENLQLREKISELNRMDEIIGTSPAMRHVLEAVENVAPTESIVLIRGEIGTGKELIARAIHNRSKRRLMPMIVVNCAAIPESLMEAELFGQEKGTVTGSKFHRKGKIELADGGTLFLDEIAELSLPVQEKLVKVIETKEFTRLGGTQSFKSDFRLLCATSKNLETEIEKGNFLEDLYYRINVVTIDVPPLRERKEDIPLLVHHFINKYRGTIRKRITEIDDEAMAFLRSYHWPGNVRELENAIERAMVIGTPPKIVLEDLPIRCIKEEKPESDSLKAVEKAHIHNVLKRTNWNISKAAKILQIDRVTLYNKIKKYQLKRMEPEPSS